MKRRSKISPYLRVILCSLIPGISFFQPSLYANLLLNAQLMQWQHPQTPQPRDFAAMEKMGWVRLDSVYKPTQSSQRANRANHYRTDKTCFDKNTTISASAQNSRCGEIGIEPFDPAVIHSADTDWSGPAQCRNKLNKVFAQAAGKAEYITIFIAKLSGASGESKRPHSITLPDTLNGMLLLKRASAD